MNEHSVVADVGAGKGIFAELLLPVAGTVLAVEPNEAMRGTMESRLGGMSGFQSVDGTAEATGLPDGSVDLITAAQAFHWFRPAETRAEFRRIGKPDAWTALIWNERLVEEMPFLRAYEDFLRAYSTDYAQVDHRNVSDEILTEFYGGEFSREVFPNEQTFDLEGLLGRAFSSSYLPGENDPAAEEIRRALGEVFEKYQSGGKVGFIYRTLVAFGRIA